MRCSLASTALPRAHYSRTLGGKCFTILAGTPVYVLTAKTLTTRGVPPLWVTAWAYVAASLMLVVITVIINATPTLLRFMCPPPDEECGNGWDLPGDAVWALLYWIFFVSAVAYGLITWGNQHLESSVTSSFFALQPVAAAVVSFAIVATTAPPHHGLSGPGIQHLGAVGVIAGLWLIVSGPASSPVSGPGAGPKRFEA